MFEAAQRFPDFRLPELFCGFDRADATTPVPYPVACSPQAWAAADPYKAAGLFASVDVIAWNKVIG